MPNIEDSITLEMAKKDSPPPFESIPSQTANRYSSHRTLADNMVVMRDGIRLATDIYIPESSTLFPTILIRMPYGKN